MKNAPTFLQTAIILFKSFNISRGGIHLLTDIRTVIAKLAHKLALIDVTSLNTVYL